MVQDFVTVRLMSYQFGWLIQKLKMEEDKLSLSFNTWLAYGVNQNHIENHNKSGIKNIYISIHRSDHNSFKSSKNSL